MDEQLTLRIYVTVHTGDQARLSECVLEMQAPWETLGSLAYNCGEAVQTCAYAAVSDALPELERREAGDAEADDLAF